MKPFAHRPVGPDAVEERCATEGVALHLVAVHDGVDRPHVGRVPLDGLQADGLGPAVVATLLEPEGQHAEQEPEGIVGRREGLDAPPDAVAQMTGVAREEVDLVADIEGEHVTGRCEEEFVEDPPGLGHPPVDPRLRRAEVELLAFGGVVGAPRPGVERRDRRSPVAGSVDRRGR